MINLNQLKSTAANARAERTAHTLIPGVGYVRLGEPRMPERPVHPPSACLPPMGTPDLTIAKFVVPGTTVPTIMMQWLAAQRLWAPLSPISGNRLAFTPAYLAALGWKLHVDG